MVYIDTEMKFSERRLIQIMKHQAELPASGQSGPTSAITYEHLLNRVHVIRPLTGVPRGMLPHACRVG